MGGTMSKWFGIGFMAIGIGIYREIYLATLFGTIIVATVSAGIGGAVGSIYDSLFGKHDAKIMDVIDNILWFLLFCIPGAIVGLLVAIPFDLNMKYDFQTIILLGVMIIVSYFLTKRKIKAKNNQNNNMVL